MADLIHRSRFHQVALLLAHDAICLHIFSQWDLSLATIRPQNSLNTCTSKKKKSEVSNNLPLVSPTHKHFNHPWRRYQRLLHEESWKGVEKGINPEAGLDLPHWPLFRHFALNKLYKVHQQTFSTWIICSSRFDVCLKCSLDFFFFLEQRRYNNFQPGVKKV